MAMTERQRQKEMLANQLTDADWLPPVKYRQKNKYNLQYMYNQTIVCRNWKCSWYSRVL